MREYHAIMQCDAHTMKVVIAPNAAFFSRIEKKIAMQRVDGEKISNIHGKEEVTEGPNKVLVWTVCMFGILFDNYNYCYPDSTGYNFIIDKNNKIWIIDNGFCALIRHLDQNGIWRLDKLDVLNQILQAFSWKESLEYRFEVILLKKKNLLMNK